ncbi:MAG: phosphorylase [Candidatus Nephthysia bennettiae]|uniref:MTAP family purine nucleoside phosphorylase n=1 Tax=Candidatus Nephthysia bennettiae TaxID=3127016 RepID=A0A934ND12_9BACT|nr:MTAP family purine nucleoside phosphorylase [Candidatus Dormibacteraeota bacterium]MBJ7613654.1 MTAP family purine nucleoside phosphorylase [Candidatus Dormibacteraeota bacterium]PZR97047.1 MAG: phosphorylase [Candidatus Dormibacteraeota bacterium]
MRLGVISGTGAYEWPGLVDPVLQTRETAYGPVEVTVGEVGGVQVVHLSRHGRRHARLSNHVDHRANLSALLGCSVDGLVSLTLCGAVDPSVALGSVVVFDDLYFPANRLPDGTLCTWHDTPGGRGRSHWIFDRPFNEPLRQALLGAARQLAVPAVAGGCYGHVDGPRFNTRAEIAALGRCGVTAVSQTAGPEVVLAGESELPMALLGYVTDHANGVAEAPEPVEALIARAQASLATFAAVVEAAVAGLGALRPAGIVYRFEP